jgi:hypothetical protein
MHLGHRPIVRTHGPPRAGGGGRRPPRATRWGLRSVARRPSPVGGGSVPCRAPVRGTNVPRPAPVTGATPVVRRLSVGWGRRPVPGACWRDQRPARYPSAGGTRSATPLAPVGGGNVRRLTSLSRATPRTRRLRGAPPAVRRLSVGGASRAGCLSVGSAPPPGIRQRRHPWRPDPGHVGGGYVWRLASLSRAGLAPRPSVGAGSAPIVCGGGSAHRPAPVGGGSVPCRVPVAGISAPARYPSAGTRPAGPPAGQRPSFVTWRPSAGPGLAPLARRGARPRARRPSSGPGPALVACGGGYVRRPATLSRATSRTRRPS